MRATAPVSDGELKTVGCSSPSPRHWPVCGCEAIETFTRLASLVESQGKARRRDQKASLNIADRGMMERPRICRRRDKSSRFETRSISEQRR